MRSMLQRRRYSRLLSGARVLFCWRDRGQSKVAEGLARNISAGGMYIASTICPPDNSTVRCQLLLPALTKDAAPQTCTIANAVGRVLREETDGAGEGGFAIQYRAFVLKEKIVGGSFG